jgi:hypothetical protein
MTEDIGSDRHRRGSSTPSGEWDTLFQMVRDTRIDVRENRRETSGMRDDLNGLSVQVAVLVNESQTFKKKATDTDEDIRTLQSRVGRLERSPAAKDKKASAGLISGIAGTAIGIVLAVKEVIAYFGSGSH